MKDSRQTDNDPTVREVLADPSKMRHVLKDPCVIASLLMGCVAILAFIVMIAVANWSDRSKDSVITRDVVDQTPEAAAEDTQLTKIERESEVILDWILNSVDVLSECIRAGRTDWSLRGTQLEMFAMTLRGAGEDWVDGRADSYSVYEVSRAVNGANEVIRELKRECGIR